MVINNDSKAAIAAEIERLKVYLDRFKAGILQDDVDVDSINVLMSRINTFCYSTITMTLQVDPSFVVRPSA